MSKNKTKIVYERDNYIFDLYPVCPVSMLKDRDAENHDIVIINGIVYIKKNKRSKNEFENELNESVDKNNVYYKLFNVLKLFSIEELGELTKDGILISVINNRIAAIKHLNSYFVKYKKYTYKFPSIAIICPIEISDGRIIVGDPEVLGIHKKTGEFIKGIYRHPFVYKGINVIGMKVCLGTFDRKDIEEWDKMEPHKKIITLIRQTKQILISGYNSDVHPAQRRLTDRDYYGDFIVHVEDEHDDEDDDEDEEEDEEDE